MYSCTMKLMPKSGIVREEPLNTRGPVSSVLMLHMGSINSTMNAASEPLMWQSSSTIAVILRVIFVCVVLVVYSLYVWKDGQKHKYSLLNNEVVMVPEKEVQVLLPISEAEQQFLTTLQLAVVIPMLWFSNSGDAKVTAEDGKVVVKVDFNEQRLSVKNRRNKPSTWAHYSLVTQQSSRLMTRSISSAQSEVTMRTGLMLAGFCRPVSEIVVRKNLSKDHRGESSPETLYVGERDGRVCVFSDNKIVAVADTNWVKSKMKVASKCDTGLIAFAVSVWKNDNRFTKATTLLAKLNFWIAFVSIFSGLLLVLFAIMIISFRHSYADRYLRLLSSLDYLPTLGRMDKAAIKGGQWWRLVTSIFVYTDFLHLYYAIAGLLLIGFDMEAWLGASQTTMLYLACGLFGNIFFILFSPNSAISFKPIAGPSGAIFGLIGAKLVFHFRHRTLLRLQRLFSWYDVAWICSDMFMHFIPGMGIHVGTQMGGFFTGVLLSLFIGPRLSHDERRLNASDGKLPSRSLDNHPLAASILQCLGILRRVRTSTYV